MASRAQKYGTTYVPAYRMALRWEQIQAEIKAEGERAQAAAEEADRERAALADLDARFAAEGVSPDVLAGYLAAVGAERQASTAAGGAARVAQAKADTAAQRILDAPRVTQELVDGLVSGGRAPSPALAAALQAKLAAAPTAATAVAGLRPGGTGARGPSAGVVEQRELIRLTAPEAAYSPAAQPLIDQRAVTPVSVRGAESLSEAQLLGAYTTALQGGTGGDLAGRFQAALGAIAPAGAEPQALLAAADQLYTRVRQEGSFSRQDRKYFEPTWLAAADAARAATEEAEALKPGYTDPAREAARREIIARGLNPDDKYVALVGDRRYDYLTTADRIYGEVDGAVKPATPEQTKIAEFVSYLKREADRTGKPVELKTLERELGKTLKGKALVEGIGFALALAKSESEKPEDRKTQADLQREAELTAQRLQEIEATRAAAAAEAQRIESDLQAEVTALTREAGTRAELTERFSPNEPGLTPAQGRSRQATIAQRIPEDLQVATQRELQAVRSGGDPVARAARLRALGYTPDQIKAIFAAIRPELAPPQSPAATSPPASPMRRLSLGVEEINVPRSPVPASRPVAPAPTPAPAAAAPPPTAAPPTAAPPAAPVSEVDQLKTLLKSGVLKPGTPQYDAALDRLDELEGL